MFRFKTPLAALPSLPPCPPRRVLVQLFRPSFLDPHKDASRHHNRQSGHDPRWPSRAPSPRTPRRLRRHENSGWWIAMGHDICDPRQKRGWMHVQDPSALQWRPVRVSINLYFSACVSRVLSNLFPRILLSAFLFPLLRCVPLVAVLLVTLPPRVLEMPLQEVCPGSATPRVLLRNCAETNEWRIARIEGAQSLRCDSCICHAESLSVQRQVFIMNAPHRQAFSHLNPIANAMVWCPLQRGERMHRVPTSRSRVTLLDSSFDSLCLASSPD